jgi:predicted nucleic acid-binding protein
MSELNCFVIDSSVLLAYKEGKADAKKLIYDAIDGNVSVVVPAYSLFILSRLDSFDRKTEIGFVSLLKFIATIQIDAPTAMRAGYLYKSISNNSNPYKQVDLFSMVDPLQNQIEDSITCAVAENENNSIISNRINSIENTNAEWIILGS